MLCKKLLNYNNGLIFDLHEFSLPAFWVRGCTLTVFNTIFSSSHLLRHLSWNCCSWRYQILPEFNDDFTWTNDYYLSLKGKCTTNPFSERETVNGSLVSLVRKYPLAVESFFGNFWGNKPVYTPPPPHAPVIRGYCQHRCVSAAEKRIRHLPRSGNRPL